MTISSAYIFGKQLTEATPPATMFENGQFSRDFVSNYYQPGGAYAPEGTGVFETIRALEMETYGKSAYNSASNLYALGNDFQNLYGISGGNIARSCTSGNSLSQSGCSVFIPLNNLTNAYKTISVEFKMENVKSFSNLTIGACKISGDAYQSLGLQSSDVSGSWATLNLQLAEAVVLDALEIQSSYGSYQIRKIVFA